MNKLKQGSYIIFRHKGSGVVIEGRVVESNQHRTLVDRSIPYISYQDWYSEQDIEILCECETYADMREELECSVWDSEDWYWEEHDND